MSGFADFESDGVENAFRCAKRRSQVNDVRRSESGCFQGFTCLREVASTDSAPGIPKDARAQLNPNRERLCPIGRSA